MGVPKSELAGGKNLDLTKKGLEVTDQPGSEAVESIVMAVDTSDEQRAIELLNLATSSGAKRIKLGQELFSAPGIGGVEGALSLAGDLRAVIDAKTFDIGKTVLNTIKNLASYAETFAITVPLISADEKGLRSVQEAAGDKTILGVTILSSVEEASCQRHYGKSRLDINRILVEDALDYGVGGMVVSGEDTLKMIQEEYPEVSERGMVLMVPGIRSVWADLGGQSPENILTPAKAIALGATWLVVGSPITNPTTNTDSRYQDSKSSLMQIATEIEQAQQKAA